MLCRPGSLETVPDDPQLLASWKEDGWRALCATTGTDAVIRSRGGHHITQVPYIANYLSLLGIPDRTVLDGEIVDHARPRQLRRTGRILESAAPHVPSREDPGLTFAVFDMLFIDGEDLRDVPLEQRLQQLKDVLGPPLAKVDPYEVLSVVLLEHVPASAAFAYGALDLGKEGIVVKHRDSLYRHGSRKDWYRYKPQDTADGRCTDIIRGDDGEVTSLAFELDSGATGQVASGLTALDRAHIDAEPNAYLGRIIEIAHHGVERSGALRHPVFHGVRHPDDKPPARPRRAKSVAKVSAQSSKGPGNRRNYRAMKNPKKLIACRDSLKARSGEAFTRCMETGSQDPDGDLKVVLEELARRGITD
jgi:ATP-dependent DNA ligase